MQIGFNGRFFAGNWRPALVEIAFAREYGFTALQFLGKPEGLGAEHTAAPLEDVAEALQVAGITAVMELVVSVDATGRTEAGSTPLAFLEANLAAIRALGCACVHWHLVPLDGVDAAAARAIEAALVPQLTAAVRLGAANGFHFGIEHNEPELLLFGTPTACADALVAVPDLGMVWDFNHTIPQHVADFQALIPRMSMLHISDSPLPEVNYHLPLGLGTIDIHGYCAALRAGGFNGPAILEIGGLPKSGGYGRDTDAALIDSGQRLRKAWTQDIES